MFAEFLSVAGSDTKATLTTGMTTDRKNFDFLPRRGIMAEIEYPGVAQLVGRDIWDVEVGCSSHLTRTKIPLKSLISEGFFLFFVYCGAKGEAETKYTTLAQTTVRIYSLLTFSEIRFK